jgi:pimeloyl-ACP methyl ester carboxylesterase
VSTQELARRIRNPELGALGMRLLRRFDVVDQLAHVTCPTLVCVGDLDPVTPVAAAREIAGGLPPGMENATCPSPPRYARPEDAVAVFFAEVGDVGTSGFEDAQAE